MQDLYLIILIIALPLMAQIYIKVSYSNNSKRKNEKGLTGYDTARAILDKNGLNDMVIVETKGTLTDHYDPSRKVVRLSTDIYHNTSVAAMAVAAHECGHAIQDKKGYFFFKLRSTLVPVVSFISRIAYIVMIIGFFLEYINMIYAAIIMVGAGVLFQIVTLPVEIDASKRAHKELEEISLASNRDLDGVKNMLTAAALTYVAGALSEILQLIRLIGIARDRN